MPPPAPDDPPIQIADHDSEARILVRVDRSLLDFSPSPAPPSARRAHQDLLLDSLASSVIHRTGAHSPYPNLAGHPCRVNQEPDLRTMPASD